MMAGYLNETGRPILFACEWPLYQNVKELKVSCYDQNVLRSPVCVRFIHNWLTTSLKY